MADMKKTHNRYVHGYTNTPTFNSWMSMKGRCKYEGRTHYHGRGITMCKEWESFEQFLKDMGERPAGTTLDRIDNEGNYEPSNCRWASVKEQSNNRRTNKIVEWNGQTKTVAQLLEIAVVKESTLRYRIRKGWDVQRAITEPTHERMSRVSAPKP